MPLTAGQGMHPGALAQLEDTRDTAGSHFRLPMNSGAAQASFGAMRMQAGYSAAQAIFR